MTAAACPSSAAGAQPIPIILDIVMWPVPTTSGPRPNSKEASFRSCDGSMVSNYDFSLFRTLSSSKMSAKCHIKNR